MDHTIKEREAEATRYISQDSIFFFYNVKL